MKKNYAVFFIAVIIALNANAQNWLTTGNSGLTSSNYLGTNDANDLIFKTNATEYGKLLSSGTWHFGGNKNYVQITSAGKLSFNGKATYLVGSNAYVFQYSANTNYGLFFNSTNLTYEFRNSNAS